MKAKRSGSGQRQLRRDNERLQARLEEEKRKVTALHALVQHPPHGIELRDYQAVQAERDDWATICAIQRAWIEALEPGCRIEDVIDADSN